MMLLSVLIPALFSCYFVSAIEPAPSFDLRGVDGNSPSGCKCAPTDSCWPSISTWNALNESLSGKLIKDTPPAVVCYPGQQENLEACANLLVELTNSTFIGNNPFALDYPINDTCPPVDYSAGAVPGTCSIGGTPVYAVNATSPADVSQGINFARCHGIRLVVRNTGHDLSGRSTGYGSLEVWIRYLRQGITYQETYSASNKCTKSNWQGGSITIAGGYVWSDAYEVSNQQNVVIVGGGDPSVGCIGGWTQGGGHSPASRDHGLGADQLLEAQVVLATGEIVTANACENSDLYFALRGGGGGTYGVVVSGTVKVYPSTPVVAQTLAIAPLTDANIPEFMDALAVIYSSYPDLNDRGYSGYGSWSVQSYAPVFGNFTTGLQHAIAVFNQSLSSAQKIFEPVAAQLQKYNGSLFISTAYYSLPSYAAYYSSFSGTQQAVGSNAALGSRLLDRQALSQSPTGLRTMLNITAGLTGQFTSNNICLVSGGQVFIDSSDPYSGVNPAWRTSYVHNIVARGWVPGTDAATQQAIHDDITFTKVGAMRDLAPNTGSYMNEADRLDPLFLQDFYGENLAKLQAVKMKYDPLGIFYCPTCVGSESWHMDYTGRLCFNFSS